ncbi:hypothetical protein BJ742DRAFT_846563 [Cladochytrium replicatum]|nr:hypothetical protein BJ742DRAFT_846563 [Cladochytrium replicatum]
MRVLAVVLVHGIRSSEVCWGQFDEALHLQFKELVSTSYPNDALHILKSTSNVGVIEGGTSASGCRLAKEVAEWMEAEVIPGAARIAAHRGILNDVPIYFCVIGHSFGGIVSRYALRTLLGEDVGAGMVLDDARANDVAPDTPSLWNIVDEWNAASDTLPRIRLVPHQFMSVASPHCGVVRQLSRSAKSKLSVQMRTFIANFAAKALLGKSGRELMLLDDTGESESKDEYSASGIENTMLWKLALADGPFMKAMRQFQTATLSSILVGDVFQGYRTAAICDTHPHPEMLRYPSSSVDPELRLVSASGFQVSDGYDNRPHDELMYWRLLFSGSKFLPAEFQAINCEGLHSIPHPRLNMKMQSPETEFSGSLSTEPIRYSPDEQDTTSHEMARMNRRKSSIVRPSTLFGGELSGSPKYLRSLWPRRSSVVESVSSSESSDGDAVPLEWFESEINEKLVSELQKTTWSWRRLNIDMNLPPATRWVSHQFVIGKAYSIFPEEMQYVARQSAFLHSRIVVLDFLLAIEKYARVTETNFVAERACVATRVHGTSSEFGMGLKVGDRVLGSVLLGDGSGMAAGKNLGTGVEGQFPLEVELTEERMWADPFDGGVVNDGVPVDDGVLPPYSFGKKQSLSLGGQEARSQRDFAPIVGDEKDGLNRPGGGSGGPPDEARLSQLLDEDLTILFEHGNMQMIESCMEVLAKLGKLNAKENDMNLVIMRELIQTLSRSTLNVDGVDTTLQVGAESVPPGYSGDSVESDTEPDSTLTDVVSSASRQFVESFDAVDSARTAMTLFLFSDCILVAEPIKQKRIVAINTVVQPHTHDFLGKLLLRDVVVSQQDSNNNDGKKVTMMLVVRQANERGSSGGVVDGDAGVDTHEFEVTMETERESARFVGLVRSLKQKIRG